MNFGIFLLSCFVTLTLGENVGLVDSVGPTTDISKKTKICDITDYGAVKGNETDISTAISSAFKKCVVPNANSVLYIPEGEWLLTLPVTLSGGSAWALQIEGLISCPYSLTNWGTSGYNTAIVVKNTNDFEMFSSTGKGAIQGFGYVYRTLGAVHANNYMRLVRIVNVKNASIHDLLLIDSPMYHLVVYQCTNIEVYHITVRGGYTGMTDGIDISGYNYHVHDCHITNKDECISIKSPSVHALIEEIVCDNTAGMSIGSIKSETNVSYVQVSNIVSYYTNTMMFIKSQPGGTANSGINSVTHCLFEHFRGYNTAYGVDIDMYWDASVADGNVELKNLIFSDFAGSILAPYSGSKPTRGGVRIIGASDEPLEGITLENFSFYKNSDSKGKMIDVYQNVFGSGYLLAADSEYPSKTFTTSSTVTAAPSGWTQPALPDWAVGSAGYGTTESIPIYTPAALWTPGATNHYYSKW